MRHTIIIVALLAASLGARVDAQAAELESLGSKTLRIPSDVQDRASLQKLCDEAVLAFGQVDILMVTSGALKKMPSTEIPDDDWERIIDINLNACFFDNFIDLFTAWSDDITNLIRVNLHRKNFWRVGGKFFSWL